MDLYEQTLAECSNLIEASHLSERAKIEANFSLGQLIDTVIQDGEYGAGVVSKLAADLAKKRGRPVYPQRLYECRAVYLSFKDIEKVWALEEKIGNDISWGFLVRQCTKMPRQEETEAYAEHWENKLSGWERTVTEIEKAQGELHLLPLPVREQVEGFLAYARIPKVQSADNVLPFTLEPPDSQVLAFPKNKKEEDSQLAGILKDIVTYDEVTGEAVNREGREIHHITRRSQGGGDTLDNMIVLSHNTHIGSIHIENSIPSGTLREIVHKRNADLLAKLLNGGAELPHVSTQWLYGNRGNTHPVV